MNFTIETIRAGQPSEIRSVQKAKREIFDLKEKKEIKPSLKVEVLTKIPIPEGYIRCIVLQSFEGMTDKMVPGDIFDVPERRFKSMVFRGLVEEYKGKAIPNKQR